MVCVIHRRSAPKVWCASFTGGLLLRYGVRHSQEVCSLQRKPSSFFYDLQQTKGIAEFSSETCNIPVVLKAKLKTLRNSTNQRETPAARRPFATTVSQLKIFIFQGKPLKVLKCYNFL